MQTTARANVNKPRAARVKCLQAGNQGIHFTMNSYQKIPILKVGRVLIVPIQVDMDDQTVLHLQENILAELERTGARGVLIDISLLEIVDSFIGRMLSDIASMARIMDARTVVVGMQPAVAITLVELGLELKGVDTVLNVDEGIKLLRQEFGIDDVDDADAVGLSSFGKQINRS